MVYDCAIIGSGVAGLTAGIYLGRANKSVIIIENGVLGGTTATLERVENYPGFVSISGFDLVNKMVEQVSNFGINIDFLGIKHIDFDKNKIFTDVNEIEYKTLIIASGTSYKKLGLDNEDFYKFKGLSYCAVCDGNLYKGKKLVVATAGNSGNSEINYLKNLSDDIVVVDYEGTFDDDDVRVFSNAKITSILGKNFVEGVEVESNKETIKIPCDGLFVELGKITDVSLYKDKLEIKDGHIVSDENMHTNVNNVFVAGDVRVKNLRQIVTAASDGAIAATEALKYLSKFSK